jgi:hypothetical protein
MFHIYIWFKIQYHICLCIYKTNLFFFFFEKTQKSFAFHFIGKEFGTKLCGKMARRPRAPARAQRVALSLIRATWVVVDGWAFSKTQLSRCFQIIRIFTASILMFVWIQILPWPFSISRIRISDKLNYPLPVPTPICFFSEKTQKAFAFLFIENREFVVTCLLRG